MGKIGFSVHGKTAVASSSSHASMDKMHTIETYVYMIDQGSFSAAAQQANVPIISNARQVPALEKDLGVDTFAGAMAHVSELFSDLAVRALG